MTAWKNHRRSLLLALLCGGAGLSLQADSVVTFNEVQYHPAGDAAAEEWIELHNELALDVDVSAWTLAGGVDYRFPTGTFVRAHGYLVLAANPAALTAASGCTNVVGPLGGRLANGGDTLRLLNNSGREMDRLAYADTGDWPVAPDGGGVTLAKLRANTASDTAASWGWSAQTGGTPGQANALQAASTLTLNEIEAAAATTAWWVELVNTGTQPANLAGLALAVEGSAAARYAFGATVLPAGGFLKVSEAQLGVRPLDEDRLFLLSSAGVLDAAAVKTRLRGRSPDGTGAWRRPAAATPGAANRIARRTGVAINEIQYHARPQFEPYVAAPEEWVELVNHGTQAVDLAGWQLTEGVSYTFPSGTLLATGACLVVAADATALRARYPALAGRIVGNFDGGLADGGERLVLADPDGNPADEAAFADSGRWPAETDGYGSTLERRDPRADGTVAENWAASAESGRTGWRTYTYTTNCAASAAGPDGQWQEFVLGLIDAGEVLLDDLSVIEDPAGARVQVLQNGSFQADTVGALPAAWRIIGNHRRSVVAADPDNAANKVLRLVATGTTEHMHNHAETTLAGGRAIANGKTYTISFRARWVRGCSSVQTRLYFNRCTRKTLLDVPATEGTPGARNTAWTANAGPTWRNLQHTPAVPAAGAPVTVSVEAADPDGVAVVTNWYAVNEGAWVAVAMTHQGGGRYTGAIPGRAAADVVQFYVEGRDSRGAASTFPARGRQARALYKVQDGWADTNGRNNFRVVMLTSDVDWMFTTINRMSNDRQGATVIYNEQEIHYDVTLRLKSSERHRINDNHVGYVVYFDPGQRFCGVHRSVTLDRSAGVEANPSQREMLISLVMNRAGGTASRYTDPVKLISPRLMHTSGAELALARYGDVYLDGQFADGSNGQLFEYELIYYPTTTDTGTAEGNKLPSPDGVVGMNIAYAGANKETYRWVFMVDNNAIRDDYARWIPFTQAFGQANPAFYQTIGAWIDVDVWLRSFAVAACSGAQDNYGAGSQHNGQFYVRPADGRVVYLPFDLDFTAGYNYSITPSPDLNKLIAAPGYARAYYGHLLDLVQTSYNTNYLQRYRAQLGTLLTGQDVAAWYTYVGQRSAYIRTQLAAAAAPAEPFSVTNPPASAAAESVVLGGRAWLDVYRIAIEGRPGDLVPQWTATGSGTTRRYAWTATVPLEPGTNTLRVLAYDYQGNIVGDQTVTILCTKTERPLRDYLRVTEVLADPPGGTDFEFVELCNTGPVTLDLTNVVFDAGVDFSFAAGSVRTLAPGQYTVVVRDRAAFATRYATNGLSIAGTFTGKLDNGGEKLRLRGRWNTDILAFTYGGGRGWPAAAAGAGHSLVPLPQGLAGATRGLLDYGGNWRASARLYGSPGRADPEPDGRIAINEIAAHTDYLDPLRPEYDSNDWIELFNRGAEPVSLAGWYLSDDPADLRKWAIPATNTLPPGGFVRFTEVGGFHDPIATGFGLDKAGEQLFLAYLPGTAENRIVDAVAFKGQENELSLARHADGTNAWYALPRTPGATNAAPAAHVVIGEIMYAPSSTATNAAGALRDAFIELHNAGAAAVPLWTEAGPWRLDGVDYTFPAGTVLPAQDRLLVVSFAPASDAAARAGFLAAYGLTNGQVRLFGPWEGTLSGQGERLAVERPQAGDLPGDPVSWVIVDEAIYFADDPWPAAAAADGNALARAVTRGDGNVPANWLAAGASPGQALQPLWIADPRAGSSLVAPLDLDVRAEVVTESFAAPVVSVEFLLDGSRFATAWTAPYTVRWESTPTEGVYTLQAIAHDSAGGAYTSLPRRVLVYGPPPYGGQARLRVSFPGYNRPTALADFPAPIRLGAHVPGFDYAGFASPLGYDLRFNAADGAPLSYEVEAWDTGGTSRVWVRLPVLTNNAAVWASWGDPTLTNRPPYVTDGSAWSRDFAGVWHLGADLRDAVAGLVATNNGSTDTAGAWGRGRRFDGVGNYIAPPLAASWYAAHNQALTVSLWVNAALAREGMTPFGCGDTQRLALRYNDLRTDAWLCQGGTVGVGLTAARTNQWQHVALQLSGGRFLGALNGASLRDLGAWTNPAPASKPLLGCLGSLAGRSDWFAGGLDEVRVAAAARSADWLYAEFLLIASNTTAVAYGPVQWLDTDADGDKLPDRWEQENLGGLQPTGGGDRDGDGATDGEEYTAGTDPADPSSAPALTIRREGDATVLEWQTPPDDTYAPHVRRVYAWEHRTNWAETAWQGVAGQTNLTGNGRLLRLTPEPPRPAAAFYRGRVQVEGP